MKGVYSYYVTYMFKTIPINGNHNTILSINMSYFIHSIKISFSNYRLETTYRLVENEDGTYNIDDSLIKNEVCESLWEQNFSNKFKNLSKEELGLKKLDTIKVLSDEIVIIAWSEAKI